MCCFGDFFLRLFRNSCYRDGPFATDKRVFADELLNSFREEYLHVVFFSAKVRYLFGIADTTREKRFNPAIPATICVMYCGSGYYR